MTGLLDLGKPYTMLHLLLMGIAKLIAIGITLAAGWPGGVIFPLFFAGSAKELSQLNLYRSCFWACNSFNFSKLGECLIVSSLYDGCFGSFNHSNTLG